MPLAEMYFRIIEKGHDRIFEFSELEEIFGDKINLNEAIIWLEKAGALTYNHEEGKIYLIRDGLHIGQNLEEVRVMRHRKSIYQTWVDMRENYLPKKLKCQQ